MLLAPKASCEGMGMLGLPPSDVITPPSGSVTKKMALFSDTRFHNWAAVSRMVALSPVVNAARTSDMVLRMRLMDASLSACARHSESYARKLARTSSSKLSEALFTT